MLLGGYYKVSVQKEDAFVKQIVLSCNMSYPDEDELILHYNLINWLCQNVEGDCRISQTSNEIIFVFDTESDAVLFKIAYF